MNKKILALFYISLFLLLLILPISSLATEPVFDMTICSDTTRFNKGEKITFNLYLVGLGEISEDYLLFYVDNHMYVSSITILGFEIGDGLQDKGTNAQICQNFMQEARQGFVDYSSDEINPLYAGIFNENGTYIPPIKVEITTDAKVSSGDHDIEIFYLYKNLDGENWTQVSKTKTFHINTDLEQHEWLGFVWNIAQSFIGFGIALLIFAIGIFISKKKEKDKKGALKKNLLLMLKDEVNFNLDKAKQMQKDIPKTYSIPNYRLKTGNKDACWGKIIEFRSKEHDFINNVSTLYGKYDLLNRTIDIGTECLYHNVNTSGASSEIKRICRKIEKLSNDLLKKYFS